MTYKAATLPLLMALTINGCDRKPAAPPKPPTPTVGVLTLKGQPVTLRTELPGRTSAYLTADVRPQVSGVITKRPFVEGSDVKLGQQLYQIDPATYQASYDSALATLAHDEAALKTARAKTERYKPLARAQAVSQQDYDDAAASSNEAAADIQSARAGIEQAQINLAYTKVMAPIAGRIGRSTVTPGALVTSNQTTALATITQLDPIYVDVTQPTTTLLRLKRELAQGKLRRSGPNQARVTLLLEDGSAYPLDGTLQFSEVNVDEGTGTVLLRAIFSNPDHLLLPGMYVQEQLEEGVDEKGLLVPQQAVSRNPHGDATVMLVGADNKVASEIIQTSRAVGDNWVVTGGLAPGDRVVVDGLQNAKPGEAVNATEVQAPANAGNGRGTDTPAGTAH